MTRMLQRRFAKDIWRFFNQESITVEIGWRAQATVTFQPYAIPRNSQAKGIADAWVFDASVFQDPRKLARWDAQRISRCCLITSLEVPEEYRRQGWATRILQKLMQHCGELGIPLVLFIALQENEFQEPMQGLMRKLGWLHGEEDEYQQEWHWEKM